MNDKLTLYHRCYLSCHVIAFCVLSAFTVSPAAGSQHVLRNDALELGFEVTEGRNGGIQITRIHDLISRRQWLSQPSQLFELSARDTVWPSDNGLVIDHVEQFVRQLVVQGRTRDLRLSFELRITIESGSGPAIVSGSIRNLGKDWFGPFLLGDHELGPVPVFAQDAHIAVVRQNIHDEEVLVSGFDGILYSSEEFDDGPWSAPRPLEDTSNPTARNRFPAGAPIAAIRRNDHQRDVFAIGSDGHLYTFFRLDGAWWSPPIQLSSGIGPFLPNGSVAALSVNEQTDPASSSEARVNEVAVFGISKATGQVLMSHEINDGAFSGPTPINPAHGAVPASAQLAAVKRNQVQQDLFVIDQRGSLLTSFHIQGASLWSDFIHLSQPSSRIRPGSALAAVRGRGDDVHVFVVGQARNADSPFGSVYETFETDDGSWSELAPITPPIPQLEAGSAVSAVRRTGTEIDVMFVLRDGSIGLITRNLDGTWSNVTMLPAAAQVGATGRIAAILRRPGQLDVFGIARGSGRVWTTADGLESVFLRTVFPKIFFRGNATLKGRFGMVPQEIGGLTFLKNPSDPWNKLGMPYQSDPIAQKIGLPEAMNSLEVMNVSTGDRSLFVADLGGNVETGHASIQFILAPDEIDGFWVSPLKGQHQLSLPPFALGVGDKDWRRAVDFYVNRNPSTKRRVDIPQWLREAGAIYTFTGGGAGGIYLDLPGGGKSLWEYTHETCAQQVTFRCTLRRMFQEAKELGTNVIYLYDYWQDVKRPRSVIETCPDVPTIRPAYFCKGDYFIRDDLGGKDELQAAVDEVHRSVDDDNRPGRVILYLEPFVVHKNSAVGNAFGDLWGGRFPGEGVWPPFLNDPSIAMSQANGEWQQRVVETARTLIKETHADGIFLDSAGWRLNIPVETKQEVVLNSPIENAMAVVNLADRVRSAIRSIPGHEDAVVLSETTSGPMWRHVDGGVSADLNHSSPAFTGVDTLNGALLTSPIRYGAPQINVFSNGTTLNQLNQVFATGHGLALSTNWGNWGNSFIHDNESYVRKLVTARRRFATALVHGQQIQQLDVFGQSGSFVVAYSYAGQPAVVCILNPSANTDFAGVIPNHGFIQPGTQWRDWITGDVFSTTASGITMTVPHPVPQCESDKVCGLRILEKTKP